MGIRTKPQTYKTSDGAEFEDKDAAERRQKLLDLQAQFETAKGAFAAALGETQLTADGAVFRWEQWHYWHLTGFGGESMVEELSFYGWDAAVIDGVLHLTEYPSGNRKERRVFKIQELYSAERAANVELVRQLELHQKRIGDRVKVLSERLGLRPKTAEIE